MSDQNVYSTEEINQFIFYYNIHAGISLFFGLFSIFAILRYTTHSSMNEYKFHLLNMAINILLCDMTLTILCRPYPLMPLPGGCMLGQFNLLLIKWLGVNGTMYAVTVRI